MTRRFALILALATALCLALPLSAMAEKNKFEQEVDLEAAALALFKSGKEPTDAEVKKIAADFAEQAKKGGYEAISVAELKAMIDGKKDFVLVDTMPAEAYKAEHIPGAKQFVFPIPTMETWDAKETGGLSEADFAALLGADKSKPVVVYCGFVKCTRSHNAALWAKKLGYTKVIRVPGGIFAWKGAAYPIESSK